MKNNFLSFTKICTGLILLLLPVFLFSCSQKMNFSVSTVVPAAEGGVKIKQDRNKNYTLEVKVTHLAPASRLTPARKEYVVWMETENNGTKNIGRLRSKSGLLSKTMSAGLKTVTSFKPIRFFITAEDDAETVHPGMTVVLQTH